MIAGSKEWYRKEIAKLLAIMGSDLDYNPQIGMEHFVTKEYVHEKLSRIMTGQGIGIHPSLECVAKLKEDIPKQREYVKMVKGARIKTVTFPGMKISLKFFERGVQVKPYKQDPIFLSNLQAEVLLGEFQEFQAIKENVHQI